MPVPHDSCRLPSADVHALRTRITSTASSDIDDNNNYDDDGDCDGDDDRDVHVIPSQGFETREPAVRCARISKDNGFWLCKSCGWTDMVRAVVSCFALNFVFVPVVLSHSCVVRESFLPRDVCRRGLMSRLYC